MRGGGSRDPAPRPPARPVAPPPVRPVAPPPARPVAPPRPGAGPARAPLRRPAGGERVSPPPTPEVAASPLRRRGDCWEGRRDGGGGTRSRRPVRVKRGGRRSRSGSRPEREAQVREGRENRASGPAWGRVTPGSPAWRGRGLGGRGRELGLLGRGVRRRRAGLWGGSPWAGPGGTETRGLGSSGKGLPGPAWREEALCGRPACRGWGCRGAGVSRMGVTPRDPRRVLLRRALPWLRGSPEEAPRLGRLRRPEPVVWAASGSSLPGLTALRLPGPDAPRAPPVGAAQARRALPAGAAGTPGSRARGDGGVYLTRGCGRCGPAAPACPPPRLHRRQQGHGHDGASARGEAEPG